KISNHGRVYSKSQNIIMISQDNGGYMQISMWDNNKKQKTRRIHVLVTKHFVKKTNNTHNVAHHIDHNKKNNHYKNLRWETSSGNSQAYHDSLVLPSIIQYTTDKVFVKEWKNINEILEQNKKYKKRSIMICLNGSCESRYS